MDKFEDRVVFVNTKKSLPEKEGIYLCVSVNGVYQLLYFTNGVEKIENLFNCHNIDNCFYFWDSEWGDVIYPIRNIVAWAELPASMGLLNYFKLKE